MDESDSKRPRVTLKRASHTGNPTPPPAPKPQGGGASLRERERPEPTLTERPPVKITRQAPPPPEPSNSASLRDRPAKRPAESQSSAPPQSGAPITFDVCGHLFKVPSQLIRDSPETLLAQLLESCQTQSRTIFVDSDASRFPLILDWYRYKEIHVPSNIAIEALLLDAASLRLPEEIKINGVFRSTLPAAGPEAAQNLMQSVIRQWRGFSKYFEMTMEEIRLHYKTVGTRSASGDPEDEGYDFQPFRLQLYGETTWADPQNVSSAARARVLALKIEDRGYLCEFTDAELVVSLPLKLQGESSASAPLEEEDLLDEDFPPDKGS